MADPRFFKNLGPFTLAQICEKAGIALPAGAGGDELISDLADLSGAGPQHLAFFSGASNLREAFASSAAGACLVPPVSAIKSGSTTASISKAERRAAVSLASGSGRVTSILTMDA